jgi:hypothetical protein
VPTLTAAGMGRVAKEDVDVQADSHGFYGRHCCDRIGGQRDGV